jgi:hypothetical protein
MNTQDLDCIVIDTKYNLQGVRSLKKLLMGLLRKKADLELCAWEPSINNTTALQIVVNRKVDEQQNHFIFIRTIAPEIQ